jgi:hypothetical protein
MRTETTTLLDDILPEFDFGSRHSRRVAAPPVRIWEAVSQVDPGTGASMLARLRGLRLPPGPILEVLTESGFSVLALRPEVEMVLGTTGQFWRLHEQAHMEAPRDLQAFRTFDRPGWARAAVSLELEPRRDGSTEVTTETRVRCVDEGARYRFGAYWLLIRPFSGWLRREFLRRLAGIAEATE